MLRLIRACLLIGGLQILLAFYTSLTFAQVDPTEVLIGTWEGSARGVPGADDRTIVIRSVKPNGEGSWVAQGRYGVSGGMLGGKTIDVLLENGEIVLKFVTGPKNPVRLVLKGDKSLEGTIDLALRSHNGGGSISQCAFQTRKS